MLEVLLIVVCVVWWFVGGDGNVVVRGRSGLRRALWTISVCMCEDLFFWFQP